MNCPVCGSTMAHFKNPDRDICPTPERHGASSSAQGGRTQGAKNKGQSRPKSKDNLPKKKKGK